MHPNGTYYFRRMVPRHLQDKLHKKEIKKALESDKNISIVRCMERVIKTDHMFARSEHNYTIVEKIIMNLPNGIECTIDDLIKAKQVGIDLTYFSPVANNAPVEEPTNDLTLSELFRKFIDHKKTIKACTFITLEDYERKFNLLKDILGNVTIDTIHRDQARFVVRTLSKLPINRNKSSKYRNLSIKQMTKMPHDKTMSTKTIKSHIKLYGSLFKFAKSEELGISSKPFEKLTINNSKRQEKVIPFTSSDLEKLLSGLIYEKRQYDFNYHWMYWAPLLVLYTGLHLSQIASLRDFRLPKNRQCVVHYSQLVWNM